MSDLPEILVSFVPLLITLLAVSVLLNAAHWWLLARRPELGNERRLPRQITLFALGVAAAVTVALSLPVSDSTRNQLIGLIGVLVSGVIAFSSTTVVANLMAGLMLRVTKAFRTGDFIQVGSHFGRVVERGLFDTEIQTEHRELVSIANTLLINQPVAVLHASGTIVSAEISLGYELHHSRIEKLLIDAAQQADLSDPFVQIIKLGDFSISYRVSGLLKEVKSILSSRSQLHRQILECLHTDGIEIVSPTYMVQRPQSPPEPAIPPLIQHRETLSTSNPEALVFDKAEQAEQQERELKSARRELKALEQAVVDSDPADKPAAEAAVLSQVERVKALEAQAARKPDDDEEDAQAPSPPPA